MMIGRFFVYKMIKLCENIYKTHNIAIDLNRNDQLSVEDTAGI